MWGAVRSFPIGTVVSWTSSCHLECIKRRTQDFTEDLSGLHGRVSSSPWPLALSLTCKFFWCVYDNVKLTRWSGKRGSGVGVACSFLKSHPDKLLRFMSEKEKRVQRGVVVYFCFCFLLVGFCSRETPSFIFWWLGIGWCAVKKTRDSSLRCMLVTILSLLNSPEVCVN